jgi:hypothetical protein
LKANGPGAGFEGGEMIGLKKIKDLISENTTKYFSHGGVEEMSGRPSVMRDVFTGIYHSGDIYRGLLGRDFELFIKLSEELAENLVSEKIASVAGDASEGYNTGHEACRLIIDAAVGIALRRHGHRIANFEFQLIGPPCDYYKPPCNSAGRLYMNDGAFARKVEAIRDYSELASEVEAQLRDVSLDSFRVECLHRVSEDSAYSSRAKEKPFYERYGERQVAGGFYKDVIRYRDHMKPLEDALRERVEREK